MPGHIQLGKYTDNILRDYSLVDVERWQATNANTFVARVSTGGKYTDLDTFSDWSIQEWKQGQGYREPDQGPLFAAADSRFSNQLLLPYGFETAYPHYSHGSGVAGDDNLTELPVQSGTWYATSVTTPLSSYEVDSVWVYMRARRSATVTVKVHADNAGVPGTVLGTGTAVPYLSRPHAQWVRVGISTVNLNSNTRYHFAVTTDSAAGTDYIQSVRVGSEYATTSTNGTTWTTNTVGGSQAGIQFFYSYNFGATHTGIPRRFAKVGSVLYVCLRDRIYEVGPATSVQVVDEAEDIVDLLAVDGKLWYAFAGGYGIYDPAGPTTTRYASSPTTGFLMYSGFIWRYSTTNLLYTADGTTWTDVGAVGKFGSYIRGIAGMGDSVYAATDDGLYMVTGGDYVIQIVAWPEVKEQNGRGMCAWEGALYIPLQRTVMRYDSSGALMNIGPNTSQELPEDVRGNIYSLYPTSHFLLMSMSNTAEYNPATLWAYNVEGWHLLCMGPHGVSSGAMWQDTDNGHLIWGLERNTILRLKFPSAIQNPARDMSNMLFSRHGWIEYDKFIAGYMGLLKDFNRIVLDNEGGGSVTVFWQDEGSTAWEQLGTVGAGYNTLNWLTVGGASGRWIKIAMRLETKKPNDSPVLRGFSVKYSVNVTDRTRWTLPILISDRQQFPDGSVNTYTGAQQLAHLDTLVKETMPLKYKDINGTTYTVKVTGWSKQVLRYLQEIAGPEVQYVYALNLEEV